MAYAPARPHCGRGFSRRPAAFAKTAGFCRPPSGPFRPQRSVPQVADEAGRPRLRTVRGPVMGQQADVSCLRTDSARRRTRRLGVRVITLTPAFSSYRSARTHSEPRVRPERAARRDGGSVRRRRASDGSGPQGAGHGWPAVFAEPGWRIENPRPKPAPRGAQPPRVAAAGARRHGAPPALAEREVRDRTTARPHGNVRPPSMQVTTSPPIQMSLPSCWTCTRPARPNTVPWLAT